MTHLLAGGNVRPEQGEYAPYYGTYVAYVPDGDIVATLDRQFHDTITLLRNVSEAAASHRYAEGKWSVRKVIGHMIDAERGFFVPRPAGSPRAGRHARLGRPFDKKRPCLRRTFRF